MRFHSLSCELITPLLLMFLLINLVTEVSSLAGAFFQHLFGLLMAGYQIPISLSCGWPSRWPAQRRSLEENRAEVSIWRKPCWMGPFIPEPALQRARAERGWGLNSVPVHFSSLTPFLHCHLLLSSSSHLSLLLFSERLTESAQNYPSAYFRPGLRMFLPWPSMSSNANVHYYLSLWVKAST